MSSARGKPTANFSLEDVIRLLPDARMPKGKTISAVKERVELARHRRMTDSDAHRYIQGIIRALTPEAFVRREVLTYYEDADADLYGFQNAEGDWYVKLFIEDQELLVVVSCHEPTGTLTRSDGKKIGKPRK